VLSIACRRTSGKPLVASVRAGAVFTERWASARIGSGLIARLGTARNCMHVQVADSKLHLHPHFPFTLGFMPELYGLDLVVPLERISSATILGGNHAKAVEVAFRTPGGEQETAQLLLRNPESFVRAALSRP
jgi:hypothetical protein